MNMSRISRRALLQGSAAALALAVLAPGFAVSPALAATDDAFLKLSTFLTGKSLNPTLSARYLVALAKHNPDLDGEITALQGFIDQNGFADMDAFLAAPDLSDDLKASALKIVSAWYLGVVGEPEVAELIAFHDALMYVPTNPYIPVPTYGPGPHTWGPDIIPGVTK